MAPHRSPQKILAWRPVLLFGGGIGLAIFEAVQPLIGHEVEWAIVSLAATMMGLEMFQRSRAPDEPGPDGGKSQDDRAGPGAAGNPDNPGNRGNPGALAVLVALAAQVSHPAPAVAVAVAA
jgi:hypothetical protein